jgi:hypothetical protein
MKWRTKARAFRLLSVMPFGEALHFQLQKRVTRTLPRPAETIGTRVQAAERILTGFQTSAIAPSDAHFVEIGAGRDLAVAIALRMMGVARVTSLDMSRLARLDLIDHGVRIIASQLGRPAPSLRKWDDLERFGVRYVAPSTLEACRLPAQSVSCVFSVDTLEHIPVGQLRSFLSESRRVISEDGLVIHIVDYSDHFARDDASLHQLHFLQYSDAQWAPFNSKLQYVSRLRHSQYVRMLEQEGFQLISAKHDRLPTDPAIMNNLADRFVGFSEDDLFATRSLLIAAPKGRARREAEATFNSPGTGIAS